MLDKAITHLLYSDCNITPITVVRLARHKGGRQTDLLHINYRDSRPIYEQIKAGYRKLIATGVLAPNEKIMSVRELAAHLALNPNTIQRAYRELEAEGFIYSMAGKGSFVAEGIEISEGRQRELLKQFDIVVRELSYLNMDKAKLQARLDERFTELEEKPND